MGWCDRTLFTSPVYYGLCTNQRQFEKVLRQLKLKREDWPEFKKSEWCDATTHFFDGKGCDNCAVVTIGSTKGKSRAQIAGLLTHEAVHIWQEIRSLIGEKEPSSEFEAYAVQRIAQNLIAEYESAK